MSVVRPTTMKRLLKQYSGLHRIEKAASRVACDATDEWISSAVNRIVTLARASDRKTIDVDTVTHALEDVSPIAAHRFTWCSTRLRDRIKSLSRGFRWSLAAKIVLYNTFESYLRTLSSRIAVTQRLSGRSTIAKEHVLAAIHYT